MEIYIKAKPGLKTAFSTFLPNYSGIINMYVPMLCFGNIDLKGSTNVNDATLLQRYLAGNAEFDKLQMFYSDINRDGKTNVKDVTDLQQTITK